MSLLNALSLELKPGNKRTEKILSAIRSRYNASKRHFSGAHEKMKKREEQHQAYIVEQEADAVRRLKRDLQGIPQYTTIHIPQSYAMLMAAHTYWTSVFLGRSPIFQYAARHGEIPTSVQAVEAIIDYQVFVGEFLVPLYIWLLDKGKYGLGVLGCYWTKETEQVAQIVEKEDLLFGLIPSGKTKKVKRTVEVPGYQGNRLFNVRPYHWFPDPRVPVRRFQRGEFCGRLVEVGWNELLRREAEGSLFNLKELEKRSVLRRQEQVGSRVMEETDDTSVRGPMQLGGEYQTLLEMTIELVPKEWGLGSGERPEKWLFLTDEPVSVLLSARPLGAIHNRYPFQVLEYEPEGYSLTSRSMHEVLEPLQNTLDYLVNTHFYNVRKIINDTLVVDPGRLNMQDVRKGGAGGVWRLRPAAYGTSPSDVVHQLPIRDVTQAHLSDAVQVIEQMQKVVGVNDQVMGFLQQGGRKSAFEVRASVGFAVTRLKTNAEYDSAMGFGPLAQMLLQNTQQYLEEAVEVRLAGDLISGTGARGSLRVTPEDIVGFFDYVPVDGTLPVDRQAQAAILKEFISELAQLGLGQTFDIAKMVSYAVQLLGIKNINQFRVQVTPDQQLQSQAQAGNVVPLGGGGGGARGTDNAVVGPLGGATVTPQAAG